MRVLSLVPAGHRKGKKRYRAAINTKGNLADGCAHLGRQQRYAKHTAAACGDLMLSNTGQLLSSPPAMYLKATQPSMCRVSHWQPSSMCLHTLHNTAAPPGNESMPVMHTQHNSPPLENGTPVPHTSILHSMACGQTYHRRSNQKGRTGAADSGSPQRNVGKNRRLSPCPAEFLTVPVDLLFLSGHMFVVFKTNSSNGVQSLVRICFQFPGMPFTVLVEQKRRSSG